MPDSQQQPSPPKEKAPPPPPYRPNKDLIGYIEKGQKPPVQPARPSEQR